MTFRRIYFQLGVFAGLVAFGMTLWRATSESDFLMASLRAVAAGLGIMLFVVIIYRFMDKLDEPAPLADETVPDHSPEQE